VILEDWGASIEAVVEDILDPIKDIRHLLSNLPTITLRQALLLAPLGPWDGCMFANIHTFNDAKLFASLLERWRPAIAVISAHFGLSKADTISLLPKDVLPIYKKRLVTVPHTAVGGVTVASRRFAHYMRWTDAIWSLLMTSYVLPWTLQTALADTYGASQGASFEPQAAVIPPEARGVLSSSTGHALLPVYSSNQLGPDLSLIPFKDVLIWVQAYSVFSKVPVLRQVRVAELFAIWDYEGKLESGSWGRAHSLRILKARLSAPPAKMLRCFAQSVFDVVLLRLGAVHLEASTLRRCSPLLRRRS
jgi:hypothetical protein